MNSKSDHEIGKAYKAYLAFNWKVKKDRLKDFSLPRWLKVVQAISGEEQTIFPLTKRQYEVGTPKRKWASSTRRKFQATIAKRKNGQADHV